MVRKISVSPVADVSSPSSSPVAVAQTSGDRAALHDEADHRGAGAADVERLHVLRAFDLAVAGLARHLAGGVQKHPAAGGAHRVAAADQAPRSC
jgi:hypothetical protein